MLIPIASFEGNFLKSFSLIVLFILISPSMTMNSGDSAIIDYNLMQLNETKSDVERHYYEPFGLILIPKSAIYAGGILTAQATALISFRQPIVYRHGSTRIWSSDIMGPENSQQLTDHYTFTHVVHGFIFYWALNTGIIPLKFIPFGIQTKYLIALALESTWEIVENTPWVIQRYRDTATAQGYTGDSVLNSIGDSLAMSIGFWIAHFTPWYIPVLLTIAEEVILGILIRDNLAINIFQLFFSSNTISGWQAKMWKRKGVLGKESFNKNHSNNTIAIS